MIDFVSTIKELLSLESEQAERMRAHDKNIALGFFGLEPGRVIEDICEEATGDATYFASQIHGLVELGEYINDEENTFCVEEVETAFIELGSDIEEVINFLPAISCPNQYQGGDDTVYTFNYKRWRNEPTDYDEASKEFNRNMQRAIELCNVLGESYSLFRGKITECLQM